MHPGDRVAAWMPNLPETVIAFLATNAIGAVFSSTSADFGTAGVIDRFGQIDPVVLFAADGYTYGGRSLRLPAAARRDLCGTPHGAQGGRDGEPA